MSRKLNVELPPSSDKKAYLREYFQKVTKKRKLLKALAELRRNQDSSVAHRCSGCIEKFDNAKTHIEILNLTFKRY
jgi:succinate dehydrogenase/fumarate reductase-like Fe-S protein